MLLVTMLRTIREIVAEAFELRRVLAQRYPQMQTD